MTFIKFLVDIHLWYATLWTTNGISLDNKSFICCIYCPDTKSGLKKLVYRLIVMFLSTEIFSKRRKIYAWAEEKPE